ncbi:OmpA family protein [Granulosicoccaceae sp. 1_MG-2023]|nr:OmpA family protein [Granulosicoccaceae sp. 1_MG-2023]
MKQSSIIAAVAAAAVLAGCAADDPNRQSKSGAAIGAIAGAVLGHQIEGDKGRYVGAAIGAITGAAVGTYMDDQQRELEEQLAAEQAANEIEMQRIDEETLQLSLNSGVTFDFNSDTVKPEFYSSLNKVANVLSKYQSTAVHVIGHTDSVGSESYNQDLSERRAGSVGSYLSAHGVSSQRLLLEGRGESEPRASNATEAGRAQNRRVEIYLRAIEEGRESEAFEKI